MVDSDFDVSEEEERRASSEEEGEQQRKKKRWLKPVVTKTKVG